MAGTWGVAKVPEFLPADGLLAPSYARDSGHNAGLGPGDSLVLRFDNACKQLPVGSRAALDTLLAFSAPIGTDYSGVWDPVGRATLTITITAAAGPGAPGAAVGVLRVAVNGSAGLTSLDESTAPSNSSTRVAHGTWGDAPSLSLRVRSWRSLRASLAPPPSRFGWAVASYHVQWAASPAFEPLLGQADVAAGGDEAGVATIGGLREGVPVYVRAACVVTIVYGAEQLASPPGALGPFGDAPRPLAPARGALMRVGVLDGSAVMATAGGQAVLLAGADVGLFGTPVGAVYSNGNATHTAAGCAVTAEGASVQCVSAPGVGRGYTWTLLVDGAPAAPPAAPGAALTSYEAPVILDAARAARGGQWVHVLAGRSFGPRGGANVTRAWLTLGRDPAVVFTAAPGGCAVTRADVELTCGEPLGAGANLFWTVEIGWQLSAAPTVSYDAPAVVGVECAPSPCGALSTRGGDVVALAGAHFGPAAAAFVRGGFGGVSLVGGDGGSGAGGGAMANCSVAAAESRIVCTAPPGVGLGWDVIVTVLGQAAPSVARALSYGLPRIDTVRVPSDGALRRRLGVVGNILLVDGANFGGASAQLVLTSPSGGGRFVCCAAAPAVNHSQAAFALPRLPDALGGAPAVAVSLLMGAHESNAVLVELRPPALSPASPIALEALAPPECGGARGAPRYWLSLSGSDFGVGAALDVRDAPGGEPAWHVVCAVAPDAILWGTNATSGTVVVRVGAQASAPAALNINALLAPVAVTAVLDARSREPFSGGNTTGGDAVLLLGGVFHASYEVYLAPGATAESTRALPAAARAHLPRCAALSVSTAELVCALPPGIGRGVPLLVYARGGFVWTFVTVGYMPPLLDSVTVAGGGGGRSVPLLLSSGGEVRITGRHFGSAAGNVSVSVGGLPCALIAMVTDTAIVCTAPAGGPARVSVAITVGDQTATFESTGLGYAGPSITRVTPNVTQPAGGDTALIVGDNFPPVERPSVTFVLPWPLPPAPATVLVWTASYILVTVPPGVSGGANGSRVALRVDAAWSRAALAVGVFEYAAVALARVRPPPAGCPVAGCTITLEGSAFPPAALAALPGVLSVSVNGRPCAVVNVSARELACEAPAGSGAANAVRVAVLDRAAGLERAFAYDAPRITALAPAVIDQRAGGPVARAGAGVLASLWEVSCFDVFVTRRFNVFCVV